MAVQLRFPLLSGKLRSTTVRRGCWSGFVMDGFYTIRVKKYTKMGTKLQLGPHFVEPARCYLADPVTSVDFFLAVGATAVGSTEAVTVALLLSVS